MASKNRTRVWLALASTAIGVSAAFLWWRARAEIPPDSIRLVDNVTGIERVLREREGERLANPERFAHAEGALVREPIDPERATMLWASEDIHTYDPFTYYRYRGNLRWMLRWPEHPAGEFETKTSSEGYRENFERLREKRDLFVLVAGDSHTDGMCSNDESFANRIERELATRRPGKEIEVLNTGLSGYSFYQYLGTLEKHLALAPDAFVVAVYGGNDFLDVVRTYHYFHRTTPPARTKEYWSRLTEASRENPILLGNAFNQLYYFHTFPDQIEASLAACSETTGEIDRLGKEHGIEIVYVFIPVGFPLSGELPGAVAIAKETLGMSEQDFAQFDRVADRFLEILRARGHEPIDLREHVEGPIRKYYWSDGHINLAGQELVAKLVLPRLEASFPPDR